MAYRGSESVRVREMRAFYSGVSLRLNAPVQRERPDISQPAPGQPPRPERNEACWRGVATPIAGWCCRTICSCLLSGRIEARCLRCRRHALPRPGSSTGRSAKDFEKMGGLGSGGWNKKRGRRTVESCWVLDVNYLAKRGCLVGGSGPWQWAGGDGGLSIRLRCEAGHLHSPTPCGPGMESRRR